MGGTGNSTLTRTTWLSGVEVIDPDAIARGTMPGAPSQDAREALRRRQAATIDHESGEHATAPFTLLGVHALGQRMGNGHGSVHHL